MRKHPHKTGDTKIKYYPKGVPRYMLVYDRDHPKSYDGWVREHRWVMEKHLGRLLESSEEIHHIDGDKLNNEINNLFLTTHSDHTKLHKSMETIVMDLYKKGLVKFMGGVYKLI